MNGISRSNNETVLFVETYYGMKIFLFSCIHITAINEVDMKSTMNKHIREFRNIDYCSLQIVTEDVPVI
jgi:hypothetical protein